MKIHPRVCHQCAKANSNWHVYVGASMVGKRKRSISYHHYYSQMRKQCGHECPCANGDVPYKIKIGSEAPESCPRMLQHAIRHTRKEPWTPEDYKGVYKPREAHIKKLKRVDKAKDLRSYIKAIHPDYKENVNAKRGPEYGIGA